MFGRSALFLSVSSAPLGRDFTGHTTSPCIATSLPAWFVSLALLHSLALKIESSVFERLHFEFKGLIIDVYDCVTLYSTLFRSYTHLLGNFISTLVS